MSSGVFVDRGPGGEALVVDYDARTSWWLTADTKALGQRLAGIADGRTIRVCTTAAGMALIAWLEEQDLDVEPVRMQSLGAPGMAET